MDLSPQTHAEWTPCPFACKGTGRVDHIRVDGPLRIRTYRCDTCLRTWDGAERWADRIAGRFTEPQMIGDDNPPISGTLKGPR